MQANLPQGISISEIPLSQRKPEIPLCFRMILATGLMPIWNISYKQDLFEDK